MGGIPNNRHVIIARRDKVRVMISQGLSEKEIAEKLNIGQSTICRDLSKIKRESQKVVESVVTDVLPYEYTKSMLCLDLIIRKCWTIIDDQAGQWTNKNKMDALKLLKETTKARLEIITQGPVNLYVQKLEQEIKELGQLVREDEIVPKTFFTLGPPPGGFGDLR